MTRRRIVYRTGAGRRQRSSALRRLKCFACALIACGSAAAQDAGNYVNGDPAKADMLHFTTAKWSQIYPDRDFQGGCVMGFDAFEFSPTGYFIYNNRVHGSWRIDTLGNLDLRTRDGLKFRMVVSGSELMPTADTPFLKRANLYRQCEQ